ncbi:hypothetical protein GCM10011588_13780 [Nocardia jinanensis]|uniref:Uncharacterized protein n=1 Tax=Nocardia jinanensis TaxID=382504 RepID=A0A917RBU3_9NOCA|nr:hypothetical protein GCM10011588_13780 [Nocardia jinanensis]
MVSESNPSGSLVALGEKAEVWVTVIFHPVWSSRIVSGRDGESVLGTNRGGTRRDHPANSDQLESRLRDE